MEYSGRSSTYLPNEDDQVTYNTSSKISQPSPSLMLARPSFGFGSDFTFQLNSISSGSVPTFKPPVFNHDPELELLQVQGSHETNTLDSTLEHSTRNAVLVTGEAEKSSAGLFPQRAVVGSIVGQYAHGFPRITANPKLYLNVNTPFSTLICGVQGSGKSHSASVILEGCLIVDKRIGTLPKPLAGLCLHYDRGSVNYPCESAYLGLPATRAQLGLKSTSSVPVTVLVSPTCLETMRRIYKPLKGVNVMPFYLSTSNLNSSRMLTLMGFDDSVIMPLYLQRAMTILRTMGADRFNYDTFKKKMSKEPLNPAQESSYKMRIEMLDSYLTGNRAWDVSSYFKPGHLVIVDLRDPFTNSSLVIALFEILVGLFVERRMETGKVLLLDEAHKYLNSDPCSARFTESMTSLIRQQRHFGIRTIISTQEPTVVPDAILDLVSFLVLHRFSSPTWIKHLSKHISVDQDHEADSDWSRTISRLGLGEAVVVAPTALSIKSDSLACEPLATGFFLIRTRKRLTFDGGASIVAYKS
ncbi:hypothetical protein PGT21_028460 [Puccinia graminis f. sp. tritici]|uniref:Zona occludens toxin N-terminal domain-containing protein n=1 Tax=Puccinia graminis f. sp. tritici TaxID=56615 RepID=A0A5B0P956_PUCGR|nr:hypothetical protein PGT21_028460 [Puccinia graminis f. sp. tritici]KAA1116925.1 hypothetical protein PGTUg99_031088 [Puccinia graminis f. sp. tritici]